MNQLSKELQQLLQAKKTKRILDSNPEEVLEVITQGMLLLGIKGEKLPSDFELSFMIKMMRQDYGNLPIGEFELAFDLIIKDKLDENSETYQNFSVLYLSRMMSSYARWARQQKLPTEEVKLIEAPVVDEDDILKNSFDLYKRNKDWEHIFMGLRCFKIIYKRGLVSDFEGTLQRTEEAIKQKFRYADHKEKKQMKEILEDDEQMELNCRRMAVAEYFNKLM